MNLIEGKDITEILFEITSEYEKKLELLEKENIELRSKINHSLIYKSEEKIKQYIYETKNQTLEYIKNIITFLGLKEYIKRSKLYKKYKRRLR